MEELPVRIEGFDISNLGAEHTVASMVVFEGGAPKKAHYRRFKVRESQNGGPPEPLEAAAKRLRAVPMIWSIEQVLHRRMARWRSGADLSPHDAERDESFSSLPGLIVIDGGRGQLSAGMRALEPLVERGVTVIGLAKRLEEVFLPGPRPAGADRAELGGAAAAPAGPRRGPPLRPRLPPRPPRQGDDRLGLRRAARDRPGAQEGAAHAISAAPTASSPRAARSSRRCPGSRPRSAARSTASCTRPVSPVRRTARRPVAPRARRRRSARASRSRRRLPDAPSPSSRVWKITASTPARGRGAS